MTISSAKTSPIIPTASTDADSQRQHEDDGSLSDNLMEQFAGFYVLSVVAVNLLLSLRAQHAAREAEREDGA